MSCRRFNVPVAAMLSVGTAMSWPMSAEGQTHNANGDYHGLGCDHPNANWTYVDDSRKLMTVRGTIVGMGRDLSDGDVYVKIDPSDESREIRSDLHHTVDSNHQFKAEVGVILKDFTNTDDAPSEGPLAPLVLSTLEEGMNVVAYGDWVIDEHDFDPSRWQWWAKALVPGVGDPTRWTELHPLQYLRASHEKNADMANDFVFLFAQDWNYCRNFLSSTTESCDNSSNPARIGTQNHLPCRRSSRDWHGGTAAGAIRSNVSDRQRREQGPSPTTATGTGRSHARR